MKLGARTRSARRPWVRPLALVMGLWGSIPPASAQPARAPAGEPDEAALNTARERFREGLALEEKKDWAGARKKFEEVKETRTTPQVLFHLALCDENLGALVAALSGYQQAIDAAEAAGEPARSVAETARGHEQALRARVPRLQVALEGAEDGDEVEVAGRSAARSELAQGVLVDPGSARVVVRRDGRVIAEKSVRVAEREKATLRLVLEPRPEEEEAPPPVTPPPPAEEPSGGSKIPAFLVGGVGIASLVGAAVTFGLSRSALDEVLLTCSDPDAATGCDPATRASEDDARTLTTTSVVLASVGAALVATGVVLWFALEDDPPVAPRGAPAARRPARRLGVSPTWMGAAAHGEF